MKIIMSLRRISLLKLLFSIKIKKKSFKLNKISLKRKKPTKTIKYKLQQCTTQKNSKELQVVDRKGLTKSTGLSIFQTALTKSNNHLLQVKQVSQKRFMATVSYQTNQWQCRQQVLLFIRAS